MSPRTLFISRLIGLYCIVIGLSMMTRRQATVETVTALLQSPSMMLVSSPGEFHPEALSELYMNLSAHTAPTMEPRRTPICQ